MQTVPILINDGLVENTELDVSDRFQCCLASMLQAGVCCGLSRLYD